MKSSKAERIAQKRAVTSTKLSLFIIFNALEVHEALAALGRIVDPLSMRPRDSTRAWLIEQWRKVLKKNYEPVFELAVKCLEVTPPHPIFESAIEHLANMASRIVASKALLKHDISGRIYHTLLLKKVAKGLATYYTSIPAAHLLARLAVETTGLDVNWASLEKSITIADLACGSGTLLSAFYSANLDRYIVSTLENGGSLSEEDLARFHGVMLEQRIYGFDVLEYASHLAAAWLTLRTPDIEIKKMNIYTLPLGSRGSKDVWLGSLSIDTGHRKFCIVPKATALVSEEIGPKRAGIMAREKVGIKMPRPSLIIMNPPFARTGNVGHSLLLGHLPENERQPILQELRKYSRKIKTDLRGAVGKAGLAPMFVWLADKCITKSGRLALVLPRVCMSGVSWEPIRRMLAMDHRIDHIVISYDASKNWAWSENTVLSEILLVCTRKKSRNHVTKISYIFRLPRSALEAKILASRILNTDVRVDKEGFGIQQDIGLGTTYNLRQDLLKNERNWNTCVGFASPGLSKEAWSLHAMNRFLGLELPLTELDNAAAKVEIRKARRVEYEPIIGFDVATYQRCKSKSGKLLLNVLEGANINTLNRLEVEPNAQVAFKEECKKIAGRQAHFLIAGVGRFWLRTVGLISVFSGKPLVSNTMWTVKLQPMNKDATFVSKIQTLWLNSTPGLLGTLSLRQDSKGAFVQIKKEYLPSIKLLDLKRLDEKQQSQLLALFEKLKMHQVPSLPTQLERAKEGKGFRYELDVTLLNILNGKINLDFLTRIYDSLLRETIITAE
jgi:hypothetical protein